MRSRLVSCLVLVLVLVMACGGRPTAQPASSPEKPEPDAGAAPVNAGAAPADAGAPPPERPFAGSASEATQLISQAIDKKAEAIAKCVREFRYRKHVAHERVEISVGIDQEGRLLGVTLPKGKKDEALSSCAMGALRTAQFPRSHSGVITVTRTFEEIVQ